MTIVNLRGTHGSGKSTVAQRILAKYPHTEYNPMGARRPQGYLVNLPGNKTLAIAGPYATACGGCDAVQPYATVWPLVERLAGEADHVLFEGALISTTYGSIGAASEDYGDDIVFAFMDTPLATCVDRVNQRRAARGVAALEDITNVESKWWTITRLRDKLTSGTDKVPKRKVAVINHKEPTKAVLALLGVRITKEPT